MDTKPIVFVTTATKTRCVVNKTIFLPQTRKCHTENDIQPLKGDTQHVDIQLRDTH